MSKLICRVGLLCVVLLGMMGKSFAQSFSVQRIGEGLFLCNVSVKENKQ